MDGITPTLRTKRTNNHTALGNIRGGKCEEDMKAQKAFDKRFKTKIGGTK